MSHTTTLHVHTTQWVSQLYYAFFNGNIHCAWEFKGGTTNIFGETEEGFNKGHIIWIGDIE